MLRVLALGRVCGKSSVETDTRHRSYMPRFGKHSRHRDMPLIPSPSSSFTRAYHRLSLPSLGSPRPFPIGSSPSLERRNARRHSNLKPRYLPRTCQSIYTRIHG